jgi:hypothetical protein
VVAAEDTALPKFALPLEMTAFTTPGSNKKASCAVMMQELLLLLQDITVAARGLAVVAWLLLPLLLSHPH